MGTKTLLTVEQFLELPEEQQERYELVQGELIEVSMTTFAHNWIRDTLVYEIRKFAEAEGLGIASAEPWLRVDSNNLGCSDGAFWDSAHLAQLDWRQAPITTVPQLAFEVASPSN